MVFFPSITLFNHNNLHELPKDCLNEIKHLRSLLLNGIPHYFENISADVNIIKIDDHLFPLLITSGNINDSYVCSLYGHYISLGLESLHRIKNKWIKKIVAYGLKSLGGLVKKGGINPAIYINHSLFSTDLQPNHLTKSQIGSAVLFLKNKFPTHTIIFRSINAKTCPDLADRLKSCGFKFVATRQIYLTDTKNSDIFNARIIKSDLKLWDKKSYEVICQNEFTKADEDKILTLYHSLSIDSHSALNPKITKYCFQLLKEQSSFYLKALKKNGNIDGIVGYYIKENVLHCSFFGYDKLNPDSTLIYRLLSTLLFLEAAKHAKIFHQSAGASFYKSIRRANKFQEYQAIYTKHLSLKQKMTWSILKPIINTLAIPFMKKY